MDSSHLSTPQPAQLKESSGSGVLLLKRHYQAALLEADWRAIGVEAVPAPRSLLERWTDAAEARLRRSLG